VILLNHLNSGGRRLIGVIHQVSTAIPGALCKFTRGRDRLFGKIFTKTSRFYLWERELLRLVLPVHFTNLLWPTAGVPAQQPSDNRLKLIFGGCGRYGRDLDPPFRYQPRRFLPGVPAGMI
jgi:hypothetical protein